MRYKYASHINDLKDLKHIEWFVLHKDEYEFRSLDSEETLKRLENNIRNKNIYYSDIIKDYEKLVEQFDNDPYNYMFDVQGENIEKSVKSNRYSHYFVKISDKEQRVYTVPYRYIENNPAKNEITGKPADDFNVEMSNCKSKAMENFNTVMRHYLNYWNDGGVKAALERYESVGYGKVYRLPQTMLLYFTYNIMLFMILAETHYMGMLTHFWQILSTKPEAVYSAMSVFSGHRFLGTIAFVAITYFVIMDIYYSYGIYYLIYINNKYKMVMKYQYKVSELFSTFSEDHNLCNRGIKDEIIVKRNHRDAVYIPFIVMANRRYNFMVERTTYEDNEDGKKMRMRKRVVESVIVPKKVFYSHPLKSRIKWIFIMLIVVQAICNSSQILFY